MLLLLLVLVQLLLLLLQAGPRASRRGRHARVGWQAGVVEGSSAVLRHVALVLMLSQSLVLLVVLVAQRLVVLMMGVVVMWRLEQKWRAHAAVVGRVIG